MLTLSLVLTQGAVEPPQTVNGIEIGAAEDFATRGPAAVCMDQMVISLREGETAYLSYSGIHNGMLRLVLANGEYVDFAHGDAWADRRRAGQRPAFARDAIRYYLFERGPDVSYQAFAPSDWDEDRYRPAVSIHGTGLAGNRSDEKILIRMSLDGSEEAPCDRRYGYGWDVILGDEPIETTEAE